MDERVVQFVTLARLRSGRIEQLKADRLHSLFEFDQRSVGRAMIPRNGVQVLDVAALPEENQRVVLEFGHSRFPLIDSSNNDEILGVILAKVIYRAMVEEEQDPWERLEDFCQLPLIVPESQKIAQLFESMREKRIHIALLVDEYGELSGIVTLEDLLEGIVSEWGDAAT